MVLRPLQTSSFQIEMIAHDKGKPVARQGRKAVSLPLVRFTVEGEIVWLPKAIEEWPSRRRIYSGKSTHSRMLLVSACLSLALPTVGTRNRVVISCW